MNNKGINKSKEIARTNENKAERNENKKKNKQTRVELNLLKLSTQINNSPDYWARTHGVDISPETLQKTKNQDTKLIAAVIKASQNSNNKKKDVEEAFS